MRKIILSSVVILAFLIYAFNERNQESEHDQITAPGSVKQNQTSLTQTVTNTNYQDGEYTGDVIDAFYGNLQVKAIISAGKISDVQFLQYPNDRRTSIEINQAAIPLLKQEAIKAQSAQVDIVSGATQSSEAFRVSLQSALNKAKG